MIGTDTPHLREVLALFAHDPILMADRSWVADQNYCLPADRRGSFNEAQSTVGWRYRRIQPKGK
jgi:hypothetical protein